MFWIPHIHSRQPYFHCNADRMHRPEKFVRVLIQKEVVDPTYQPIHGSLCRSSVRYLRRDVSTWRMDCCGWSCWTETESPGLLTHSYPSSWPLSSSRSSLMTKSFPRQCEEDFGWLVEAMKWKYVLDGKLAIAWWKRTAYRLPIQDKAEWLVGNGRLYNPNNLRGEILVPMLHVVDQCPLSYLIPRQQSAFHMWQTEQGPIKRSKFSSP